MRRHCVRRVAIMSHYIETLMCRCFELDVNLNRFKLIVIFPKAYHMKSSYMSLVVPEVLVK